MCFAAKPMPVNIGFVAHTTWQSSPCETLFCSQAAKTAPLARLSTATVVPSHAPVTAAPRVARVRITIIAAPVVRLLTLASVARLWGLIVARPVVRSRIPVTVAPVARQRGPFTRTPRIPPVPVAYRRIRPTRTKHPQNPGVREAPLASRSRN